MIRVDVLLEDRLAGWVTHDPQTNRFAFDYAPDWLAQRDRHPLSPHIPLAPVPGQTPELHSTIVRQFFENLMPEGRALDEAASAHNVSKANLVGLMVALGRETAGALRLRLVDRQRTPDLAEPIVEKRHLPREELSVRIRNRHAEPFSVWDGKVRLSIAGYQDKTAAYDEGGEWYLVEGERLASTVILKPEPLASALAGQTSNEFFCMRLAHRIGLSVASVRLLHVPEPVLQIERFDRLREQGGVRRLHVIDACQALGLGVGSKYERLYGDGRDVRHIREGASLPKLFALMAGSQTPAAQRIELLRWVIYQILVGNTDAHAKNVSFFLDQRGYRLTPAYDIVSTLAFASDKLEDSFAMAIGDAFSVEELTPFEWAGFAVNCGLRARLVATEMQQLAEKVIREMDSVRKQVAAEGADMNAVDRVCRIAEEMSQRHLSLAAEIPRINNKIL